MKLSIIIPFYNAQEYLGKCLETVSACPSNEIECILVNDGSTDSSLDICESFLQKDPRFHVISQKNEGVSVARNTGIMHAIAEKIFFLDSDDYINVNKWEDVLKAAEEDFDFIAFSYYTLWADGSAKEELFHLKSMETSDMQTVRIILLASARFNTCWGKLLNRALIIRNGLKFKKGMKTGEDAVFILDYFQKASTFSVRNKSILFYRQHNNSVMHKMNMADKLDDFQAIYDSRRKLAQQWGDPNLEKEMYRQLFSIITDLFLRYSAGSTLYESAEAFREAFKSNMIQTIIQNTPYAQLSPVYKKIEYLLMKEGLFGLLAHIMKIKAKFTRLT